MVSEVSLVYGAVAMYQLCINFLVNLYLQHHTANSPHCHTLLIADADRIS